MRCLCSNHIFQEIGDGMFANNAISAALVNNDPLRAYIVMMYVSSGLWDIRNTNGVRSGWDVYSASDCLPRALLDPTTGPSYSVKETAWQKAVGTTKERWNWLEEGADAADLQSGSGLYPGAFEADTAAVIENKKEGQSVRRPELDIFGLAMLGGGRVFGVAHLYGMFFLQLPIGDDTLTEQTSLGPVWVRRRWWTLVGVLVSAESE